MYKWDINIKLFYEYKIHKYNKISELKLSSTCSLFQNQGILIFITEKKYILLKILFNCTTNNTFRTYQITVYVIQAKLYNYQSIF